MNTRFLIGILGGAAVGFTAGWSLSPRSSDSAGEPLNSRIVQLERELSVKSRELTKLEKQAEKLNAAAKTNPPDTPAFDPQSPEIVQRQERMKKQMQDKQKLKLDERMAVLRARLGLNDRQAAAVRELLEKNPSGPQSLMMQAMAGEEMDEKAMLQSILRPGEKAAELTADITALLTPEQQQAYAEFRQEQRANEVEVKTNKELARLQSSLTLTPEQKDKAFTVLSTLADQEYDNPVSPMVGLMAQQMEMRPDAPDMKELEPHKEELKAAAALAAERRQQRVEAMRGILSPEQFSLHEDQQKQASMSEFMEGAFEDMPGAFLMGAEAEAPVPPPPPAPVEEK
jgi:gas vesicle protein